MAVVYHQSVAALPQQVPNYTFAPSIDAGTPVDSAHLYAAYADFSKMVALQRLGVVGEEDVNAAIQRVDQIASQHVPLESPNGSSEGKIALIPCMLRHMEERTNAHVAGLQQRMDTMQRSMNTMQQSMNTMQQSMNNMQRNMNTMQRSVNGVQQDVNGVWQDINELTEGLAGDFERIGDSLNEINIKIRNDRARAWNRKVVGIGHGQLSVIAKEEHGTGIGLPGVVVANGVGNLNIHNLAIGGVPNIGPTTVGQLNNPNFLNVGILNYLSIAYDDSFGIVQGDTVETMGEKFKNFICIGNIP